MAESELQRMMRAKKKELQEKVRNNLGLEMDKPSKEEKDKFAIEERIEELITNPKAIDKLTEQEKDFYRIYAQQEIEEIQNANNWAQTKAKDLPIRGGLETLLEGFLGIVEQSDQQKISKYRKLLLLIEASEERHERKPKKEKTLKKEKLSEKEKLNLKIKELKDERDRLLGRKFREMQLAPDDEERDRIENYYNDQINRIEEQIRYFEKQL